MIGLLPETGLNREGKLIAPPGRRKGLILPKPNEVAHHHCGFFSAIEGIDVIPEEDWEEFLDYDPPLSLENNCPFMYDQNGRGSCASEGANGIVEVMRNKAGEEEDILFNPLFNYHTASGGIDQGSTLLENMRLVREVGCCPEAVYSRSNDFIAKPPPEAYEAAKKYRLHEFYIIRNWNEYGSALLQNFAVYSGYSGHAWFAVRLMNRTQIKWRNSWGKRWGENGFGILNMSRIMWNYGCFAARTTIVA